jgi:hypothetical protein
MVDMLAALLAFAFLILLTIGIAACYRRGPAHRLALVLVLLILLAAGVGR